MFINNNHTKNSVRIIYFISFQFQSCTFIKKDTIIIYSISFHCSILSSNPTWWKILILFYFFILTTFSISQSKRANVGYGLTPLKLSSTPLILFTWENKAIVKSWNMGPFDSKNNKILTMSLYEYPMTQILELNSHILGGSLHVSCSLDEGSKRDGDLQLGKPLNIEVIEWENKRNYKKCNLW